MKTNSSLLSGTIAFAVFSTVIYFLGAYVAKTVSETGGTMLVWVGLMGASIAPIVGLGAFARDRRKHWDLRSSLLKFTLICSLWAIVIIDCFQTGY